MPKFRPVRADRTTATNCLTPPDTPASLEEDLKKLGELFAVIGEVDDLARRVVERLHRKRHGTGFNSNLETAACAVFAKGFKTFHATRILCLTGCGVDALTLCGSLFENLVDVLYMRDGPADAERYVQFGQVEKFLHAKGMLDHRDLPESKQQWYRERLAELTPEIEPLLKLFPVQSPWWRTGRKGNPAKVSLRERAVAVNLHLCYAENYRIFCGFKHTGSAAAGFILDRDRDIVTVAAPSMDGVYHAAVHSAKYFLDLCGVFQDVYGLGIDAEVNALMEKLKETGDRVLKEHRDVCE